jgi:Gram-negative bacterial TonB protein C-terminal
MKPICRTVFLASAASLVVGAIPIRAANQPVESLEILNRARRLEELRTESGVPLLLRAQIKSSFDKREVPGQYELTWWGPNDWHEAVVLGDFRRFREGVIGGYRQVRTWEYEPQVIFDLDKILDVGSILQIGPRESVRKARKRKIAGVTLTCVEIDEKSGVARDLCFDPGTGLLVHAELQPGPGGASERRPIVDYSHAIPLSDKKFPSKVRIQRGKEFWMEVSQASLQELSGKPDPTPFVDPKDSELWQSCRDSVPAELKGAVQPTYPEDAKFEHQGGVVSFYARIEADGTISHLKTLQTPSASLERAARNAVQLWTYKPPSCQGTPVRAETLIDVSFSYPQ